MKNCKIIPDLAPDINHTNSPTIVIAGGGLAGVAAALVAARLGAKVVILEKTGTLGGLATSGMVPMFAPRTDGSRDLSRGICSELVEEMCKRMGIQVTLFWQTLNPEVLKSVIDDKILAEKNITVFFEVFLSDVEVEDGVIKSLVVSTNSGPKKIAGEIFIDATGDGVLSYLANANCLVGDDENHVVMSPTLCVQYGNINWEKFYAAKRPAREYWYDLCDKNLAPLPERHFVGMQQTDATSGVGNLGHIYGANPLDSQSLTNCYFEGRKIAKIIHKFYVEHVPGFENSVLICSAPMLGIRETRRVECDYYMTLQDYMGRATFADEIGRYNYPIDIHASSKNSEEQQNVNLELSKSQMGPNESYGIPYRALLVKNFKNLMVAGRHISSDRYIQSSIRVMPGCCITAQAAGIAAAMAIQNHCELRAVDIVELQHKLKTIS